MNRMNHMNHMNHMERCVQATMDYTRTMTSSDADHDTLAAILAEFRAESGTLHVIAGDGALHLRVAIGIPAHVLELVRVVPIGKGMAGLAAQRKCAMNSCNIQHDATGDLRPAAKETGLAGSVCVPVLDNKGEIIATLGVATRAVRAFTSDEEQLLMKRAHAFF